MEIWPPEASREALARGKGVLHRKRLAFMEVFRANEALGASNTRTAAFGAHQRHRILRDNAHHLVRIFGARQFFHQLAALLKFDVQHFCFLLQSCDVAQSLLIAVE